MGILQRPVLARSGTIICLIDKEGVLQRLGVEPEVILPAGTSVGVAVKQGVRLVDYLIGDFGNKVHAQIVSSLRGPAAAAVLDIRIIVCVTGAGHADVISTRFQKELYERVFAVVIIIARDDFVLGDQLAGVVVSFKLAVECQHAVQVTEILISLSDCFGAEQAGGFQRDHVEINIVAAGLVHVPAVDDIVITGKQPFAGSHVKVCIHRTAHDG